MTELTTAERDAGAPIDGEGAGLNTGHVGERIAVVTGANRGLGLEFVPLSTRAPMDRRDFVLIPFAPRLPHSLSD